MKNNKNNIKQILKTKPIKESIGTRIAKAVSASKKISERIVGYLSYEISFVRSVYVGRTQRPAKITALEKGIIGILLVDEISSFEKIGAILGLDVVNDKAERAILDGAIKTLRSFNAIEGDDSCIALTINGRTYAEKGERPETYGATFDIFVDPTHPAWLNIKDCIGKGITGVSEINTPCPDLNLDLETIKTYAEKQATNVHFPQERFFLESTNWIEGHNCTYTIYVCFVQSVANSEDVRAFVYDEHIDAISQPFSDYINSDDSLKKELLGKCIELECIEDIDSIILKEEEVEEARSEISEDIKEAEQQLLQEESQFDENSNKTDIEQTAVEKNSKIPGKDRLRKKALYDSLSFELELHKMFVEDDADEIWLISPWIRQTAFVRDRGPMIESFLQDENKRVFIAYSEPASSNDGKPMVDESVEPKIQLLEDQYPNFFYVQLPEFHLKNVFEVRGDQKVLFSGSFNVLSFSVTENQTHIRREEMTLAHHTVAKRKYDEFQLEFAQKYAQRIKAQIEALKPNEYENFKSEKLDYFLSIDNAEINKLFTPLQDILEEQVIVALKKRTLARLTELDQQLVVAKNTGGVNARDKKKYTNELSAIKKIINENLVLQEDPALSEHIDTTYEKLENLPLKAIFPGKKVKTAPGKSQISADAGLSTIGNSSLVQKAKDIISGALPSSKDELLKFLIALLYVFQQRNITKSELQKQITSIVLTMDGLYDGLKIDSSINNDEAINITFFINDTGISFNTLYLIGIRNQLEEHKRFARIPKIKWMNRENIESTLNKF